MRRPYLLVTGLYFTRHSLIDIGKSSIQPHNEKKQDAPKPQSPCPFRTGHCPPASWIVHLKSAFPSLGYGRAIPTIQIFRIFQGFSQKLSTCLPWADYKQNCFVLHIQAEISTSRDGLVHYGDTVLLINPQPKSTSENPRQGSAALAVNMSPAAMHNSAGLEECGVSGSTCADPSARTTFKIVR